MSNRELPTMPWYPDQFAASTRHFTWAERALYRDLLDLQWQLGTIPDNKRRLSAAVKLPFKRFDRLWRTVHKKFDRVDGGLQNYRLEQHRLAGLTYKESKRLGAQITNAKRWGKSNIKESLSERSADRSSSRSVSAQRVASESPPNPSPSLEEQEHPLPPQGGGFGLPANGGRKPREARDRSLNAWRDVTVYIDHVALTGSLPVAQRLTWAYVGEHCTDRLAVRAAESVGFRLIADRDKYTTTELQARFREAYEQQMRRIHDEPPTELHA